MLYTGTHDTDTLRGWWEGLGDLRRRAVERELRGAGVDEGEVWWSLVRLALGSRARLCMVQAQDVARAGLGGADERAGPHRAATGAGGWPRGSSERARPSGSGR